MCVLYFAVISPVRNAHNKSHQRADRGTSAFGMITIACVCLYKHVGDVFACKGKLILRFRIKTFKFRLGLLDIVVWTSKEGQYLHKDAIAQ